MYYSELYKSVRIYPATRKIVRLVYGPRVTDVTVSSILIILENGYQAFHFWTSPFDYNHRHTENW